MKLFNVGALRPATDGTRLSAANNLVQSTLAQHGLLPGSDQHEAGSVTNLSSLLMSKWSQDHIAAAPKPAFPDGARFDRTIHICASGSRNYWSYIPAAASDGVTGVVVMLHGCTQTPEDFASGTRMNELAEQNGFVVLYPEQSRGENAQSCWNWFCPRDQKRGSGEPAILAGLAEQTAAEYGVGRDRTFVAGLSAGGAMAVILAETYPDVFAAAGAHSGLPFGAANDVPSAFAAMGGKIHDGPMPNEGGPYVRTIVFHGTEDATVHPENGERIFRRARQGYVSNQTECSEQGEVNGRTHNRTIVHDAVGTPVVELWRVDGQGHAWSGGSSAGSYMDPRGPDASAEMVRFFFDAPREVN